MGVLQSEWQRSCDYHAGRVEPISIRACLINLLADKFVFVEVKRLVPISFLAGQIHLIELNLV